jgi:tetratricopeptide (TPR) repeat protein
MRDQGGRAGREFLLLGLAIFFFYGVLLWAPLIYDDRAFILNNASVVGPWTGFRSLFWAGPNGEAFEPLVVALHRLLYALTGARAPLYRLTSQLLHWANAGLVLVLFSRSFRDRRLAFLAALLFALFPAHVEVLAGSTFKKHLLVTLFTLSSLLVLERRSWPAAARVAAAWLLFALALASKETAVVLPVLAAARLAAERRKPGRPKFPELAALFGGWAALLGGYVLLRARVAPRAPGAWAGGSLGTHLLTSSKIFAWCLRHLLAPWPLSLEHSLSPASAPAGVRTWLAAAIVVAALAGLFVLYRRERRAWFGASWTLIALAPFLDLVPYMNYSLVADRYLYLASAGFLLLALALLDGAAASPAFRRFRSWIVPSLSAVALAYGCAAMSYAALFSDPRALWAHAARLAPDNPRARAAYGAALAAAGQDAAAVVELKRALSLDPDYTEPAMDLAAADSRLGFADEAVAVLEDRVRRRPDASGWKNLGVYRLKAGKIAPALDALLRAAELAPDDAPIRLDLGYAQLAARRWDDAAASFSVGGRNPALRARALSGLGEAAKGAGRLRESAADFESALALDPWNVRAVELLADDDAALGRKDEALKLCDAMLARIAALPPELTADPALVSLRDELRRRRVELMNRRSR